MKNSATPAAGGRPELPVSPVTPGYQPPRARPRLRRHAVAGSIVAAYLLAAAAAVLARPGLGVPVWLALHLLLLGAATNAVFVWSWHFAEALLHARPAPDRRGYLRLAVLNAGILAVLAGVPSGLGAVAAAGAAAVTAAVAWHVAGLAGLVRGSALAGRLRPVVWYYLAGGAALAAGAALGGVLATGAVRPAGLDTAVRLAHAHLNLLGWLGLAIIGTGFMLWPAVLRTRMPGDAPAWARRVLAVTAGGLLLTVAALLATPAVAAARWLAVAGMAAYGAGVAGSLVPAVAEMRARPPRSAAAWALLAGHGWLLAGIAADAAGLAAGLGQADGVLGGALVPMLALGVVAQILTGALTFLLPVVAGGGPAGNRRLTRILEWGWPARAVLANAGVLLLAVSPGGPARLAGWAMVLAGLGPFPVLAAVALLASRRARPHPGQPHPGQPEPGQPQSGQPQPGRPG
ncbi:MAG: hypothetical protein ACM32E_31140 [Gemmatimonadota bacterium]